MWAGLSWVTLLLHRVATRITQLYSAGGSRTAPLLWLVRWGEWLEVWAQLGPSSSPCGLKPRLKVSAAG